MPVQQAAAENRYSRMDIVGVGLSSQDTLSGGDRGAGTRSGAGLANQLVFSVAEQL
jgi:hypothetical protein